MDGRGRKRAMADEEEMWILVVALPCFDSIRFDIYAQELKSAAMVVVSLDY